MSGARGAPVDYAPAGDLKIGQVGIANLRIRTLDIPRLAAEMRDRVSRAPNLFARGAVIVDFGGLPALPDVATAAALLDALREAGVLPVALAWGSSENGRLAEALGLPLLAKFRAQYESENAAAAAPAESAAPRAAEPRAVEARAPEAIAEPARQPKRDARPAAPAEAEPGLIHTLPIRSGQQVQADGRDLTVVGTVGAGAEVIADGSIHIYGALRGRALAGARGNPQARIFCREFHAELVAIAGHYEVMEDIPAELRGKPVQIRLEAERLKIEAL
jgi:septum site-determining protein MinC